MKTLLPLFFILFLTLSFGQKKEVKKATKLFESGDVQAAIAMLETNAALFDAADAKVLNQKTFLEGRIAQANKDFDLAYEKFMAFQTAGGVDASFDTQLQTLSSDKRR